MTAAAIREPSVDYARGLARAFGGALLFAFPLLMTMEMWFLGFTLEPVRLVLFVLLSLPLIYGLAYYSGFRSAQTFRDHLLDALSALFVVLNVAPTEEMVLISYMMSPWQTLGLIVLSLGVLHAIVYTLGFAGQHPHERPWLAFIHFTVPGYVLVLAVGLYVQWTFGHVEGHGAAPLLATTVVLAFPGAIGAGAARLLI